MSETPLTDRIHLEQRLNFNLQNLQRIDGAVDRADNKSATVAAAHAGLLSILLGLAAILSGQGGLPIGRLEATLIIVAFIIYLGTSTVSTILALSALFPRLSPRSTSLFYFGAISALGNVDRLAEALDSMSSTKMLRAVEEQVYANACIAQTKFQRLRWSVSLLIVSGLLWTIIMVMLFIMLILRNTSL